MNQLRVVQRRRHDGGLVYIIERRVDPASLPWNVDYPWQSVFILLADHGYKLSWAMDYARNNRDELVRPL